MKSQFNDKTLRHRRARRCLNATLKSITSRLVGVAEFMDESRLAVVRLTAFVLEWLELCLPGCAKWSHSVG
jgi:hypothetical protein